MPFSEGTATSSSAWSTGWRCPNSGGKLFPSAQCGHQEGERGKGQEAQVNDSGHGRATVGKEEENCENLVIAFSDQGTNGSIGVGGVLVCEFSAECRTISK